MLIRRLIILALLALTLSWTLSVTVQAQSATTYDIPGTFNYTVPPGTISLIVEGWGGGGGGGAGGSAASPLATCAGGGGGAGGAYVKVQFPVVPGETVTVTVGAGGTGGARGVSPTFIGQPGGKGGNTNVFYNGYNPFVAGGGNGGLNAGCSTPGTGGGAGTFSVGTPAIELASQLGNNGANGSAASAGGAGGAGGGSFGGLADGGKGGNSKQSGASGENGRVIITPVLATAPNANNDAFTVDEGSSNLLDVLSNDSGTSPVITNVSNPPHGTASIEANQIRYQPDSNYFGSDSFTYTISNAAGTDTATVSITVNPVNDPPVAINDSASAIIGVPKTIDVLDNDFDIDGPSLTITAVSGASQGTTAIVANQIVYTAEISAVGTDTFTYTISDGFLSDTATVTVSISGTTNTPPDAKNDAISVNEGNSITFDPRGNDEDADGDTLVISGVSIPNHGTASFTPTSITYTPNSNYFGSDVFTYSISDGQGGVDTATVNVTVNPVNDPPVAINDNATTNENTPVIIPVLGNDFDIDGPSLAIISAGSASHGTVAFTAASITYTPNSGYSGFDSFTYTISDGFLSDTATVNVTVNAVNNPPSADNDVYNVVSGNTLNGNVLSDDSDPNGDPLSALLVTAPTHAASFTLNADGSFSYTPSDDFSGDDSFTYAAFDGVFTSNIATAFITVSPTEPEPENRQPIAQNDRYTTAFNTAVSGNVLANDSDPDGDPLSASLTGAPSNGTLTLNPNGSFTYTPNSGFSGADSFTYSASDGALAAGATAFITVEGPPPTCTPNPKGDLSYDWEIGSASATARITNNSPLCTYQVGFAVYQRPDAPIDNQILYDYDGDTANGGAVQLGPNQSATLTVDLPDCAAQLDLFYGRVLPSLKGQRYGDRLLKGTFINGSNWCAPPSGN